MWAPYRETAKGIVRAVLPKWCPRRERDFSCRVSIRGYRERAWGPGYCLSIARCKTHALAFTVYPPGWVPYGRMPISARTPEAFPVGGDRSKGTVFAAARDAAVGIHWARSGAGPEQPVQRTQSRWVHLTARLAGVSSEVSERTREELSAVLGVPLLALTEATKAYAQGGWSERGEAVMAVWRARSPSGHTLDAQLYAGELTGLWGRGSRWDPGGQGTLRRSY